MILLFLKMHSKSKNIRKKNAKILFLKHLKIVLSKANIYDEQVKKLYEEMEAQIKAEKSLILAQVSFMEMESFIGDLVIALILIGKD